MPHKCQTPLIKSVAPSGQPEIPARSGEREFRTTHWSVVLLARRDDTVRAAPALAELCRVYWYPLYAYVRRLGRGAEDAQDLTQEFFARLIEKQWLDNVDRERGKFRSFLLTAFNAAETGRESGHGWRRERISEVVGHKVNAGRSYYGLSWRADGKFLFGAGDYPENFIISTANFPAGFFHHVAGTYDGTAFRLYVDGNLEGQLLSSATLDYSGPYPWTIGSNPSVVGSIGYPRTWNGVIDELKIWDRALSDAELQANAAVIPDTITGLVYRDLDANCAQSGLGEIGVGGRFVKLTDGLGVIRYAMTRVGGTYAVKAPAGSYTVTLVHDADTVETCNAGAGVTHNVTVSGGSAATGLNFGVARKCQATVSCVSRISWPCPQDPPVPCTHGNDRHFRNLCPCEPFQYAVTVRNTGTDPLEAGAVIRLHLAQEVMFCGFPAQISDHAAFDVVGSLTANGQGIPNPYPDCEVDCSPNTGQIVRWRLNNALAPGDSCTFFVNVQVANVPLGTIPCAIPSLRAFCKPGHIPLNVTGPAWCDKVLCSYDPNDLTVAPAGCGPGGNVPPDTTLTYRVQFQNLGSDAARRVIVRNPLDPALDPDTLEILSTSHPVTDFKILPGQAMVWTFDFIDLPAAITDEARSHGEIRYRIKPKTSAGTGTAIRNNADIYFDLNAPIRTVTTLNTLSTDPAPVAIFNVTPHSGSAGFAHDFTYTGGTAGATFAWDFGPDATPRTSTLANPAGVVFNNAGPHLVTLRTSLGDCESEPAVRIVTVGRPLLAIDAAPGGPLLSWEGDGYRVQETDSLSPPIVWRPVSATPVGLSGFYSVQLTEPGSTRFYRLEQAQ